MWIKYYHGFEGIETLLEGDDIEDFLNYLIDDPEWQGTLKITVEYFPEGIEENEDTSEAG